MVHRFVVATTLLILDGSTSRGFAFEAICFAAILTAYVVEFPGQILKLRLVQSNVGYMLDENRHIIFGN